MIRGAPRDASIYTPRRYAGLVVSCPYKILRLVNKAKWRRFGGSTLLPCTITIFQVLFASLFSWRCLAGSSSSFLHAAITPPPTLLGRINPHPCLHRHRFPVPRYAKRPDAALNTIDPWTLSLSHTEHDALWQPPAALSDEYPRLPKSSRVQGCRNALTSTFLEDTVVESRSMVSYHHPRYTRWRHAHDLCLLLRHD